MPMPNNSTILLAETCRQLAVCIRAPNLGKIPELLKHFVM